MIAKPTPDLTEIQKAVEIIVGTGRGRVIEVRVPNTPRGTWSGYYNRSKLIQDVFDLSSAESTPNVYWTIQEIDPALLQPGRENQLRAGVSETTRDVNVNKYIWLPIDCDPIREGGVSSTDDEKAEAECVAYDVRRFLNHRNISSVLADSGNGYHVLVPLNVLNQNGTSKLVEKVLKALNATFGNSAVGIDEKVYNPSRILKIYGSVARKGVHTDERPWRTSRLVDVSATLIPLSKEQLQALLDQIVKNLPLEKVSAITAPKKYEPPVAGTKIVEHRNNAVRDYAWHVWRNQTSSLPDPEDLKTKVYSFNQEFCSPPLDESELDRTVLSSTIKKDRAVDEIVLIDGVQAGTTKDPFEEPTERERLKQVLERAAAILNADEAEPHSIIVNTIADLRQLEFASPGFPKPLTNKSLWGLMGDLVEIAYPTTVASREMLLFQALPALGVVLGKKFYAPFGADRHYGTVWTLNAARTADGKGSVKNIVLLVMKAVDETLSKYGVKTNITSGEGLARVACGTGMAGSMTRLLWVMPEMAMLFNSMHREGSILSHLLREAYDAQQLENERSDKRKSFTATNYLLGMMGTTSPAELRKTMPVIDWHNGIANRFLWNVGAKTKKMNTSRNVPDFSAWAVRFNDVMKLNSQYSADQNAIDYSAEGLDCWNAWVDALPEEDEDSLYGLSQVRIKPNCLRTALFYAQIDEERLNGEPLLIAPRHIEAGIEIVTRSAESTDYYLNGGQGKPSTVADSDIRRLYEAIAGKARETGQPELTRTEITRMFRRKTEEQKDEICLAANLHLEQRPNLGGRGAPVDVWCVNKG